MQMILSFLLQNSIHYLLPLLLAMFKWEGSDSPPPPPPPTHSPLLPCPALWLPSSPPLPSPHHPSQPLSLPASHGLCLWLNAGILSQRLPVAKRDGAPRRSWAECMWVTASQKEAFHPSFPPPSPDSSPFSLSSSFFCAFIPFRYSRVKS